MTGPVKRQQIRMDLICPHCGAKGVAVWEENSAINPLGPESKLISLSGRFARQPGGIAGQPDITCLSCGTRVAD
jgi:DNA-directed RNA polymerase subunit RPC12/RpoP